MDRAPRHAIIGDRLREQVQWALLEYKAASQRFRDISSALINGLSSARAVRKAVQAGEAARTALDHYVSALETYNDFRIRGIGPCKHSAESPVRSKMTSSLKGSERPFLTPPVD
jgi:hypothetical protein